MRRYCNLNHHVGRPPGAYWYISIMLLFGMMGCASTSSNDALGLANADYQHGRYTRALVRAEAVKQKSRGETHDQAAYLAGLSAYRTGDLAKAERLLADSAQSTDLKTSANAKAQLGLVRLDQNRPHEAARFFEDAQSKLDGSDAQQAARYAAAARAQTGDFSAARDWVARSDAATSTFASTGRSASSISPNAPGERAIVGGGFSLQVGAFSERKRAESAAREAQTLARNAGLGEVRVIPPAASAEGSAGGGKMALYFVQMGHFTSRFAADSARTRLGRLDYIVATSR